MFIVPSDEVKRLGGNIDFDSVDVGKWFFMQARVSYAQVGGEKMFSGFHHFERATFNAFNRFWWLFGASPIGGERCSDGNRNELLLPKRHSEITVEAGGGRNGHDEYRQCFRFSQSVLLWPAQLARLGIEADPGYLYLTMPNIPEGRLGPTDHSYLCPPDRKPEFEIRWHRTKHILQATLPEIPRGFIVDVEQLINGREVLTEALKKKPPVVKQRISCPGSNSADDARWRCHGQLILAPPKYLRQPGERYEYGENNYSTFKAEDYQRILKTPFEFPPGWVAETAAVLSKLPVFRTTRFVRSFRRFAFGGETYEAAMEAMSRREEKAEETFPRGEANLDGPDIAWRYSPDPWLVQLVLFAHLIGGRYLTRVLSSLALGFGRKNIDWNSPLFSEKPALKAVG